MTNKYLEKVAANFEIRPHSDTVDWSVYAVSSLDKDEMQRYYAYRDQHDTLKGALGKILPGAAVGAAAGGP
jgi:hypothetical protein